LFCFFRSAAFVLALTGIALSGCGDASEELAARVNRAPITKAEVNALLVKHNLKPEQASDKQRADALEQLITQQLMVEGAHGLDLPEDPAMRLANKELLARAYLETRLRDLPHPDDAAVAAYYEQHPELFAERRHYQLQQIVIQASGDDLSALNARYQQIGTLNELVSWLKERGLPHQVGAAITPAEELPQDLLQHLKDAREGEVFKISTSTGVTVLQLVRSTTDPVALAEVEGDIRKFLRNRQLEQALQGIDAELRANAKIEKYPPYDQP
jgi:EpsD family peptidyl-prolyl cis-trans isomerase